MTAFLTLMAGLSFMSMAAVFGIGRLERLRIAFRDCSLICLVGTIAMAVT